MLRSLIIFIVLFSTILLAGNTMQFTVEEDYMNHRAKIYASGDIERGTALKFVNFVKEHNIGSAMVYFNSYGGSLHEGILLGEIIREMGYFTTIGTKNNRLSGVCASACAYAFAGGTSRYIHYDRQRLGLHQFYNETNRNIGDIGSTQQTTAKIVKFLSDMGIDERAFVVASTTNKNEMTWLTKAEALKLNFANNGKNETTAEIQLVPSSTAGQKIYLRLEQGRAEGTGKLLFYCIDNTMNVRGMILTNEENAIRHSQSAKRHYFELSDGELLVQKGQNGISAKNNSISVDRELSSTDIDRILNSNIMNIWIEDGGDFRWGIEVDIYPVKGKMREFMKGCQVKEKDVLSYF